MELLVKRDGVNLYPTEGKVELEDDVPDFLKVPRVVDKHSVNDLKQRSEDDDLLIDTPNDFEIDMNNADFSWQNYLLFKERCESLGIPLDPIPHIPAFWSGYRSAITQDPTTGDWYRLKGISLDPQNPFSVKMSDSEDEKMWRIQGGQESYSARFEKRMSDRFNRVLREEGIDPVMEVKGFWKYPNLARRTKPYASVSKIAGDTRLDELLFVLESLYTKKMKGKTRNDGGIQFGGCTPNGIKFLEVLAKFHYDVGFVIGRLKRLMDKNGQTWSSEYEQSNAHIGNIVLYNGSDKLKVGFVDFDASCDTTELSRSQLKAIQDREYNLLLSNAQNLVHISPRQINGKPFIDVKGILIPRTDNGNREFLVNGIVNGYHSRKRSYTNEVDLGMLKGIISLLRADGFFSFPPRPSRRQGLEDFIEYDPFKDKFGLNNYIINYKDKDDYGLGNTIFGKNNNEKLCNSFEEIIRNQYGFQSGKYGSIEKSLY